VKQLLILIMLFPITLLASPSEKIKKSLALWNPLSVQVNSGKIKIVTDEFRVTDSIYKAIIKYGICMPVWSKKPESIEGINEISVLNKFEKKGYVFKGGRELCIAMGKLPDKEADGLLMGNSRLY